MAARAATGTYTATANSFNPAVTGTTIDAAAWNAILTEIEAEITDCVSRSGKGGMLADIDMSSRYINNLGSASVSHQAVNLGIVQSLSATLASRINDLSAGYVTLSAAHTTLSAAHTTLSAAHASLSADFVARDYLVLSAGAALNNERVLTMGVGLSASDAGAGGTFTVSLADGLVRDLATASAAIKHGDILYVNASHNLVALGPGSSGQFLRTQGISANPVWATIAGGGDMLAANNLSDVANVASARANLGVAHATAADYWAATAGKVLESSATWEAAKFVNLTDAATVSANFALGINFTVTLGGNRALQNPTNPKEGQTGSIYISQSGGARTLSYGSAWKFEGGTAPALSTALSTASGAFDVLDYQVLSANFVRGQLTKNVK